MEFKDWVVASLGLPNNIESAIELSLQLAAKFIKALNSASTRLDEETLTGAMIGALVSAHPMSAASFPLDPVSAIRWSSYTKYGSGIHSERNSGADFALVLSFPDGRLRLAIFQAKSDWSASARKNRLVVGQIKKVPEVKDADGVITERSYLRNQVEALVEAANAIQFKENECLSVDNLTWVHYLCQFEGGVRAVALSEIKDQVLFSINFCKEVAVTLAQDDGTELDKLLEQGCRSGSVHWLEVPTLGHGDLPAAIDLSALVKLMPVVVGREGSTGPTLKMGPGVAEHALSEPLLDVPEPTPNPTRIKKLGM
ncbi:hypothetical protein [Xanthomonas arboricola]|uniref:hypothetical protein n=1 Tax=Xanthomonas arboricola TaxID=56448 RepID=UPI000B05D9C1|nr:hypothetical protein [Xanthomonas arboricola]